MLLLPSRVPVYLYKELRLLLSSTDTKIPYSHSQNSCSAITHSSPTWKILNHFLFTPDLQINGQFKENIRRAWQSAFYFSKSFKWKNNYKHYLLNKSEISQVISKADFVS